MKKTAIFLICLTIFICASFFALYKIDTYRMANDEPVIFSTWGNEYSPAEDIEDAVNDNTYDDSVYIEIDEDTINPRGLNAKIINNTSSNIAFVDYYRIEKKLNNIWCYYDYVSCDPPSWNDMAYIVDPNGFMDVGFYWQQMYGELEKGEYRIVKEYYDNADMSNRMHYLYGEFILS